ncbi:F-box/WD repeat-containing protein 8 isoform X3 [Rhipicephalus microplus]|uniref:F-box/WD repeat-containing protein 8 isoform X3 n=1 Tax=Rhipicephalus microplus TaxID=6941 RepID=UPI003F6AE8FE
MSELDSFRSQWLRELKVDAAKPVVPVDGDRAADVCSQDRLVAGFDGRLKRAVKRRLVQLESNTVCQEQPRAFDIADCLLQGEILTNDDLFGKCEEKRRHLGRRTNKPVGCAEAAPAQKSSLVDTLINDLDEINEIPFFDSYIPSEVAVNIFKHLDVVDLCRCAQVSRDWRSVAESRLLWHRHCHRMGFADVAVAARNTNWKHHFREHVQRESLLRHNWKNRIGRLYELEYSRAGVLSAVDSSEDFVLAGYSSGEVRLWHRTSSGVQLRSVVLDGASLHPNNLNYVSSVALAKSCFVVSYAEGEVCVGGLGDSLSAACNQAIALPGPAKVSASKQDNHFAAFGGTNVALVDTSGQTQSVQLPTKVTHVALLPIMHGHRQLPVVSAAEDAVRLHAGERFEADGLTLHHLIGATVTCLDVSDAVIALGLTDRSAVNVFQVPLYVAENGRLLGTLTSHTSSILCVNVAHCPDNLALTGSCDKKHPVKHLRADHSTLVTAHVPHNLFPEPEDGNIVVHTRQRGSIRMYDFSANQQTSGIPSICLSSYSEPAGYNYNVRLAVPYDEIVDVI